MARSDAATLPTFSFRAEVGAVPAARRALDSVVRLDPVCLAEAHVMVSELMANAIDHGDLGGQGEILMLVDQDRARVRVTISHPAPARAETARMGMGLTVVDRLSRRWDLSCADGIFEVWFEVRAPGTTGSVVDFDDAEILDRAKSDDAFRDEAVRRFRSFARGLAWRFNGRGVADADLEQVALFGLLNAMNRFDPAKGPFKPFAAVTIQGELKRHLRDRGWSVRVPRSLQERALLVADTSQFLAQTLGRSPTNADIGQELGVSEDQVLEALAARAAYRSESIDASHDGAPGTLAESLREGETALRSDEWDELAEAIRSLPPRDREMLYLRFYRDMTQAEIAEVLGMSQMHVSRLLSRLTDRLRHIVD
ncbi:MAG: sigma-70 family RNA polymerase sigma factor [Acidimicrobiia bacterium]